MDEGTPHNKKSLIVRYGFPVASSNMMAFILGKLNFQLVSTERYYIYCQLTQRQVTPSRQSKRDQSP